MALRIRKTGTVTASFASAQQVDISHTNDSVNIGDGTNLFGPLTNVGGTLCFPVDIKQVAAGTLATSTLQTSGGQKTQVVDESGNSLDATNVGGNYALKVDVVSSVGGSAAPAFTDDAAATVGTTQCTPIGGLCDEVATDSVDEGDVGIVRMTADRMLYVKIGADAVGATSAKQDTMITSLQLIDDVVFVDDAAFTPAVSKGMAIGAQCDEAATDSVDEGDFGVLRMTADRQLYVKVGNTVTVTATDLSTIAAAVQTEDVASADAHKGMGCLAVRKATPANTSGTDGDYEFLQMSAGRLWASATIDAALPAGANAIGKLAANSGVDIGDVDVTSVTCAAANAKVDVGLINAVTPLMGAGNTGTGSLRVTIASDQATVAVTPGGNVAHDAADSGNPTKIGFKALDSKPTAVAAADRSDAYCTLDGRLLVAGAPAGNTLYQQTTITASTSETTIVSAAASKHRDLLLLTITNSSSTALIVTLKDSTAGTTRAIYALAANGGIVIPCQLCPMYQLAAVNNNWTLTCGTSVSSIYVSAMFMERD